MVISRTARVSVRGQFHCLKKNDFQPISNHFRPFSITLKLVHKKYKLISFGGPDHMNQKHFLSILGIGLLSTQALFLNNQAWCQTTNDSGLRPNDVGNSISSGGNPVRSDRILSVPLTTDEPRRNTNRIRANQIDTFSVPTHIARDRHGRRRRVYSAPLCTGNFFQAANVQSCCDREVGDQLRCMNDIAGGQCTVSMESVTSRCNTSDIEPLRQRCEAAIQNTFCEMGSTQSFCTNNSIPYERQNRGDARRTVMASMPTPGTERFRQTVWGSDRAGIPLDPHVESFLRSLNNPLSDDTYRNITLANNLLYRTQRLAGSLDLLAGNGTTMMTPTQELHRVLHEANTNSREMNAMRAALNTPCQRFRAAAQAQNPNSAAQTAAQTVQNIAPANSPVNSNAQHGTPGVEDSGVRRSISSEAPGHSPGSSQGPSTSPAQSSSTSAN